MSRPQKIFLVVMALIQMPIWMLATYHFGRATAWGECDALIDHMSVTK